MRLLVTGGAGFIGSEFIRYWIKNYKDDSIVNFDKLTYAGNLYNLSQIEKMPNYQFIKGDITNASEVNEAMKDIDIVVHFAAESHVDRSILEPSTFIKTNIVGTAVLLESALQHKVKRFHHVSTDEVFGSLDMNSNDKFDEKTPYDPRSPYSASKASSDMLVRAYHHTFGLPITISNCSNNYGPYQFPEKLIPLMIINAMQNKPLPVYGDGLNIRDWIYTEDHVRAIEMILNHGTNGETYCVGGESEMANIDVVKSILQILKKDESLISFVKDRPGHDRRYAISNDKISSELHYKPLHNFESGIKATINWYLENTEWWERVLKGDYQKYYASQYGKR
jgi:dTDP-glucose 4,6-dehydratase